MGGLGSTACRGCFPSSPAARQRAGTSKQQPGAACTLAAPLLDECTTALPCHRPAPSPPLQLLARQRIPSGAYADPLSHIFDEFDRDQRCASLGWVDEHAQPGLISMHVVAG